MARHKQYIVPLHYYKPLESVTTITEAAERWCLGRSTIRNAIRVEHIAAVQSGRTWLISVPSLVARYGDPPTLSGVSGGCQGPETALQITPERKEKHERDCHSQRAKTTAR